MSISNRTFSLIIVMLMLLFSAGCMKKESFPDTPQIGLNGFQLVFDTSLYAKKGVLSVTFQDGDGNLGLSERDTLSPYDKSGPYYYNFVITYFEKQNGVFKTVTLDPPFSGRLPLLSPNYPNKAIKGVIVDTLPMNPAPVFDTVKFEVFLYDRALNKSNVVTTPEIILRRR